MKLRTQKEHFTDVLVRVLAKVPAMTVVIIDEVDTDNWGMAAFP